MFNEEKVVITYGAFVTFKDYSIRERIINNQFKGEVLKFFNCFSLKKQNAIYLDGNFLDIKSPMEPEKVLW